MLYSLVIFKNVFDPGNVFSRVILSMSGFKYLNSHFRAHTMACALLNAITSAAILKLSFIIAKHIIQLQ